MRIIFIRNAFLGGHRYTAGECTEVAEALAAYLEELNLAYVERPAAAEAQTERRPAPAVTSQKKKPAARKKETGR